MPLLETQWPEESLPPEPPTATSWVPVEVTPERTGKCLSSGAWRVHVTASLLVMTASASPQTTNWEPVQIAARRPAEVPELRGVQVTPSALVRIVPPSPTAATCVPLQVAALSVFGDSEVAKLLVVQLTPSGLVRMILVPT
jgi:hypothetical protein